MKKILLMGMLILLLSGCSDNSGLANPKENKNITLSGLSLTTDRPLYHSNEVMQINVTFVSDSVVENLTLNVYGIMSGRYRLDISKQIDAGIGENFVGLTYRTPPCTGCAGIRPGSYGITAEISHNKTAMAKADNSVEIAQ